MVKGLIKKANYSKVNSDKYIKGSRPKADDKHEQMWYIVRGIDIIRLTQK